MNRGQPRNNAEKNHIVFFAQKLYNKRVKGAKDEENIYHFINGVFDCNFRQRVPGFIVTRTGATGRKKSKCRCKMHNRHGQGFKPNMRAAPLC